MSSLYSLLEEYKNYTVKLIEIMEKEDYDSVEEFLNERGRIIENIEKLQYSKEEFSKAVEEHKILMLQEKLNSLMNEKKSNIRIELDKISGNKNAAKVYQQASKNNSMHFNMKI